MVKKMIAITIIAMTIFICVACNTQNSTNGEITLGTKGTSNEIVQTTDQTQTAEPIETTKKSIVYPEETTVYIPTADDKTVERYELKISVYADEAPQKNSEQTYVSYNPYLFNASMHNYDSKTNSFIDTLGLASFYYETGDTEYLLNKSNPIAAVNFAPMVKAKEKLIMVYDDKSVIGQMIVFDETNNEVLRINDNNNEFDVAALNAGKEYILVVEFMHRPFTVFFGDGSMTNGKMDMYYLVMKFTKE